MVDEAIGVRASVVEERGRFHVVLDVTFADGGVRHRIQSYPTRVQAERAARLFERAADRDPGPRPPEELPSPHPRGTP